MPSDSADDSSVFGGRTLAQAERRVSEGSSDAFELFCSYYLGIMPDDGYQKPNIEEIVRRHSMSADEIRELLTEYDLEPQTLKGSAFDLQGAQLDIRLAPQGISRTETARDLYQEYLDSK